MIKLNFFIFIFVLPLCFKAQIDKEVKKWNSYLDSAVKLRIFYPKNWDLVKKGDGKVRYFIKSPLAEKNDIFRENIYLSCKPNYNEDIDISYFIRDHYLDKLKKNFKSFSLLNKKFEEIDGLESVCIEYNFEQPIEGLLTKIGAIEYYFIFNKHIYNFVYTYIAEHKDEHRQTALKILHHIEFGRENVY